MVVDSDCRESHFLRGRIVLAYPSTYVLCKVGPGHLHYVRMTDLRSVQPPPPPPPQAPPPPPGEPMPEEEKQSDDDDSDSESLTPSICRRISEWEKQGDDTNNGYACDDDYVHDDDVPVTPTVPPGATLVDDTCDHVVDDVPVTPASDVPVPKAPPMCVVEAALWKTAMPKARPSLKARVSDRSRSRPR